MKTFKDLVFKPRGYIGGTQARLDFDNNYGVSVITGKGTYTTDGTYEVAIFHNKCLCYTTHITDDVLGNQTTDDVTRVMRHAQELDGD